MHDDLLRANVGDALVIERRTYLHQAWAFEVTRPQLDGSNVRHELSLSVGRHGEDWVASVRAWTDRIGCGRSPTSPREAVRAAAVEYDELNGLGGRVEAGGLVDALDRAGVFRAVMLEAAHVAPQGVN